MNKYVYTDKQLNELNQGPNVYSVNTEFAQRKVITPEICRITSHIGY